MEKTHYYFHMYIYLDNLISYLHNNLHVKLCNMLYLKYSLKYLSVVGLRVITETYIFICK